jgi:hypothetical protein
MFTTPTLTPVGGFIDEVSKIRAGWLNYVSNNFPNALDAIGGGYYQFTAAIRLSSDTAQVKINSPALAQPTKLLGYVTIGVSDDVNYPVGVGTLTVSSAATFSAAVTFSAGVTYTGAITYSNTVAFNGAVTVNAATTFTSNGDVTLQSGCAVTGSSGSSLTMDSGATTTLNGAAVLANVTSFTLASGATFLLAANVTVATASRSYIRARMSLQYVDITYWFQDPLYVRSYPAIMSQLIAGAVAFQVDNVVWEADVPDAATITTVSWTINPVVAVRAGLPATMPKFWVEVVNTSTGAIVHSANVTDTSPDVATYETLHTITTAALNWTIDRSVEMVLVRVQGEAGANFTAGMLAHAPRCNFSRTKLAEE